MSSAAARVGILRTDAVLENFQDAHGDYPKMFRDLLLSVDPDLDIVDYDARVAVPPQVDCDAYVITGSRHSVYDALPWISELADFLGRARAAGAKLLGICFGHQLLAHFFGGEVRPAEAGWAVGVHASRVLKSQPWMAGAPRQAFALLSSHKDQVVKLPDGAELYAGNDFCPLAGYVIGDEVMTVQGHPEFAKAYSRDLMAYREEILGPQTYAAGLASLDEEIHPGVFARWMVDFIHGHGSG